MGQCLKGRELREIMNFGVDTENASVFTHFTKVSESLASKYNFVYHPYLMYSEVSDGEK